MVRLSSIGLTILLVLASACDASTTPREIFEEAVHLDLDAKTKLAFEAYLRAARLGLPEAEFNVAVMLDSGRGVRRDVEQAAVWYARAAARGNHRAAYNLALLYADGEGVPRNEGISNAWFAASGLPASTSRRTKMHGQDSGKTSKLQVPTPVIPEGGTAVGSTCRTLEIVWTAAAQPESVHYVVELRSTGAVDAYDALLRPISTSSLVVDVPAKGGSYAWRVFAVSSKMGQYLPSAWTVFQVLKERHSGTVSNPTE